MERTKSPGTKVVDFLPEKLVHMTQFTDDHGGVIIMFTPCLPDGNLDPIREPYFRGQITVNYQPVTFNFPSSVKRLEDCYPIWQETIEATIEEMKSNLIRNQLLSSNLGKPQ